jgi:Ice-binding-like/Bacterial Ig-like domain
MKLKNVFSIMAMLLIVFMYGCKKDNPVVHPSVTSTYPARNDTSIVLDANITATFSTPMQPSTITATSFTLMKGTASVLGVVSYSDLTATFNPNDKLDPSTVYLGTVTIEAKDLAGNPMKANYIFSFTSGRAPDVTPPTVTLFDPLNNATGVATSKAVVVTFSEAMNPSTINTTTFTLKQGTTAVPGAVTYTGVKATFTPAANLAPNLIYTATITTGATDVAGNALAANIVLTFTTGAIADVIKPTSISTDPGTTATGVALNKVVAFTFSEPMAPSTINGTTFTLKQGTTPVTGVVTYSGTTAIFTPASPLAAGLPYTGTITTGATDVAGNALAADIVLTFTTDAAPTVTLTDPADLATGVVLNKAVTATFSVPMDPLTLTATTFTLKQGTTPVTGTVSYGGSTATFTPAANLVANTTYTATITTGAKNVLGTPLAGDKVWSFTTGTTSGAAVGTPDPINTGTSVPINAVVGLTFSVPMDPATIIAGLTLLDGTTPVAGTVTYSGNTATFTPTNPLVAGHTYTIKLTGAKDLAGNAFTDAQWLFTTATAASSGPVVVDLKTAARFGILAYTAITSNGGGASVINNMDVGIYPGALSQITGFPPTTIVGGVMIGANSPDPAPADLRQAKDDLVAAYNQAANATSPTPILVPAGLGGRTLGPGIYKSASSMTLANGNLTLNGGANDVWIFQIGSELIITGGASGTYGNIILTGGAQAKNVFWQVGTSATIGDYTSFKGTVMAMTSITMGTGSTAVGRMLARTGAVTLTSTNTVINSLAKP